MNMNEMYPSRYLKATDLDAATVLTISNVVLEEVGQDKKKMPVVFFKGMKKGLALNKTNATTITKLAGSPDTDSWIGTRITLFPTEVNFKSDLVPALRVSSTPPKTVAKAAPAPKAPAIQFAEQAEPDEEPREPGDESEQPDSEVGF